MTIYGEQGRTTAFLTECKHRFMVSGVEPYEAQNQYWCALEWGKRCYNLTYSDLCREKQAHEKGEEK